MSTSSTSSSARLPASAAIVAWRSCAVFTNSPFGVGLDLQRRTEFARPFLGHTVDEKIDQRELDTDRAPR